MSIEDILKSNDIIFSSEIEDYSSFPPDTYDYLKKYIILLQNKKLNIKKTFDFRCKTTPFAEDVLMDWFNSIAASLISFSRYFNFNNNTFIAKDPNDEYLINFGESFREEVGEIISLKRDLEEVLGDCIPEILSYMANSDREDCRAYAAFFPQCPKEAIRKLMSDNVDWVRGMALKHPHAKDLEVFI